MPRKPAAPSAQQMHDAAAHALYDILARGRPVRDSNGRLVVDDQGRPVFSPPSAADIRNGLDYARTPPPSEAMERAEQMRAVIKAAVEGKAAKLAAEDDEDEE